ncbi:MAG: EutP/PduV family microcompartment system protein [Brevinema sp.]
MKKIMVVGPVGSGKSTLVNYFEHEHTDVLKTVVPEYHNNMLDTPGEYVEHRVYYGNLQVISAECDCVALLVACDSHDIFFPPNIVQIFLGKPCIGIVSKIDLGTKEDRERCRELLHYAGVQTIFELSVKSGKGLEGLQKFISDDIERG